MSRIVLVWKKSHEQECSRLQKQLEEQSKQRSEATNEKAQLEEQLLQLKQQTEDNHISQQLLWLVAKQEVGGKEAIQAEEEVERLLLKELKLDEK